MKARRKQLHAASRCPRGGLAALQLVISIAVVFTAAAAFYKVAVLGCHNLHQIVAGMVGSPYL